LFAAHHVAGPEQQLVIRQTGPVVEAKRAAPDTSPWQAGQHCTDLETSPHMLNRGPARREAIIVIGPVWYEVHHRESPTHACGWVEHTFPPVRHTDVTWTG